MKVSEITAQNVADYLRLNYTTMTVSEKAELATLLSVAKAFVKSYTGLEDISPELESVGTGDGETTNFLLAYHPVTSETIYIDGVETEDYTLESATGIIVFDSAPNGDITASYTAIRTDGFEDFVIAVYILCQDLYDNRAMYVDKSNVNRVVDAILGLHCVNLL